MGTVGDSPLPTNDDDTDSPSPLTVRDALALPSAVGSKTIVTAHVAPGCSTPPHPFDEIENGAAGGVTAEMLIATPEVFWTTASRGGDCVPTSTVPKSIAGVMSSAMGRWRIQTSTPFGMAVPDSSVLAVDANATNRPLEDIDGCTAL